MYLLGIFTEYKYTQKSFDLCTCLGNNGQTLLARDRGTDMGVPWSTRKVMGSGPGKVRLTTTGTLWPMYAASLAYSLNCLVCIRVLRVSRVVWKRKGNALSRSVVILDGLVLGYGCGVPVSSLLWNSEGSGCDCPYRASLYNSALSIACAGFQIQVGAV